MIDTERLMLIPDRMDEDESRDRPYRQMCVAAVAAALDAEVALEIAIAQLVSEARKLNAPVRANVANAVAA
ncbi:MAG: hypothetical protein Q8M31_13565 [Beijerinckiaceae bacterium]|nr:hypothetical protein [Beijerinckiaceae bacterium]